MKKRTLLWTALFCFLSPVLVLAALYGGSWNNSLLFQNDRLDTSRAPLGYSEDLDLFAKKIGGTDASIFSDINYARDFGSPDKKRFELLSLYLDWTGIASGLDLRAGRQRNYEGISPVYMDGLKLKRNFGDKAILTAAGGVRFPSRYSNEFINRDADSGVVDLLLRGDYKLQNGRAGLVYQHDLKSFKSVTQDAEFFLSRDLGEKGYARGNLVYDIFEKKLRRFQLFSTVQCTERLSLDAEVSKEEPKIDSSSIFEKKVFTAYAEGSVNGYFSFSPDFNASLGYLARRFGGPKEMAHEVSARLGFHILDLWLRQDLGYGGKSSQADAAARVLNMENFRTDLKAGMIRYSYPDPNSSVQYGWMGGLAVDMGPRQAFWDVKLEGQTLKNRYYQYDNRVYLSTGVRFSKFAK
jgi:hypothetical protein